jgi:peroxiredoxin
MPLSIGDHVPRVTLFEPSGSGPTPVSTDDLFGGRKVVLVGMPGAFTPTCHRNHLPGFIENRDSILEKGVDEIVVLSTNDAFVLGAWAQASGADGRLRFVSDGNGEFVRQAGLEMDGTARGMGIRAKRFAMILEDGVVTSLAVEDAPGQATVSSAAHILEELGA